MSASTPLYANAEATLDDLLALASSRYTVEFEPVSAGGVSLQIAQIANMREILDRVIAENALQDAVHTLPLWAKVWPASLVLGHVLAKLPAPGPSLLEVGAGCGVSALVGAALGYEKVCISDINEDALLFARINALKNGLGHKVQVCRIDVADDTPAPSGASSAGAQPAHAGNGRFSLILASEILYLEHLYRPLVKFFKRRLDIGGEVLLATDHRRKAKAFFKRAAKEFSLSESRIGVAAGQEKEAERHLLLIHRLKPLR